MLEPDALYDSRRVLSPAAEISALFLLQFTATIYTGEWLGLRPRAITIQLAGHTAAPASSIYHLFITHNNKINNFHYYMRTSGMIHVEQQSPVKLNTPQSAPLWSVESARAAPDFSAQFVTKTLPMPRATGICAPATCFRCRCRRRRRLAPRTAQRVGCGLAA